MVRHWHICISGFRQDLAAPTGTETLHNALRQISAPDTATELRLWNEDWPDYAAYVRRNSPPDFTATVFGYSWGGGWGAISLCRQLRKLDRRHLPRRQPTPRRVEHLTLCDAVYRSPWTPDWLPLNPKSLLPHPKITVPDNVARVTWFTQRNDRPRGHRVVAADPGRTVIEPRIELPGSTHGSADDHPDVHHAALAAAGLPF